MSEIPPRIFLVKAAKSLGIKKPSDWGKVTWKQFRKIGGGALLNKYKNSILFLLKEVYEGTYRLFYIVQTLNGSWSGSNEDQGTFGNRNKINEHFWIVLQKNSKLNLPDIGEVLPQPNSAVEMELLCFENMEASTQYSKMLFQVDIHINK